MQEQAAANKNSVQALVDQKIKQMIEEGPKKKSERDDASSRGENGPGSLRGSSFFNRKRRFDDDDSDEKKNYDDGSGLGSMLNATPGRSSTKPMKLVNIMGSNKSSPKKTLDSERDKDKKSSAARARSESPNKRTSNKGTERGIPEENPDDGSIKTIEREDSNNRLYTDELQSPIDANVFVRSSINSQEKRKKKPKMNRPPLSSESCEQSN